jgi:hypothetical protein
VVAIALTGLWFFYSLGTERGRFERFIAKISAHPSRHIGVQVGVDTLDSIDVSSRYIARTVDSAYSHLSRAYGRPGVTYYSPSVDMPTQETIWQFPGYFVRLYATSALECDGVEIGVFSGTYEDLRGERLAPDADPCVRFSRIDYSSPKRFLYPDR